jgi:hypothetical protein
LSESDSKDGKLMIVEGIVPRGSAPSEAKNRDITMWYLVGGLERTEEEWRNILRDSSFDLQEVRKTGFSFDMMLARPV